MQAALARELFISGVVCVPVAELATAAARRLAIAELDHEITNFPEFKREYRRDGAEVRDVGKPVDKRPLVMGGFAALGTASSFHNMFVRKMRLLMYEYAKRLFQALVSLPEFVERYPRPSEYMLEELIDRLMIRSIGLSPSAESWHKDSSPDSLPDDLIFGGWVNFSQFIQKFSCQLNSQFSSTERVGYAPIRDKELKAQLNATKTIVSINPGEWVVFFDRIDHEIVAKPQREVVLRLFIGMRLTRSAAPLMGEARLREVLATGAIVPMKSGQLPPMYAKLHIVNWAERLEAWSVDAIRGDLLVEVRSKTTGKWRTLVPRFMPSLEELDEPFPAYRDNETRILFPQPLFP